MDFPNFYCYVFLFISDFLNLDTACWPFSQFSQGFIYLVDSLKVPAPQLVDSLNSSSCFHLVDLALDFDYFLPSIPLG